MWYLLDKNEQQQQQHLILRMKTKRSKQSRIIPSHSLQMWSWACLHFLFTLCFCSSLQAQPADTIKDIQIQYQTINIDTKSITHPFTSFSIKDVVKYHGLYFCLFNEKPLDSDFHNEFSHILVIQPYDFSFREVKIPDGIVFSEYSQMFIRNDSILIKGYYKDEKDYCIISCSPSEEGQNSWTLKETIPLSSVVFEDKEYKIVYTDNGEWGQYMSFISLFDDVEHIYRCSGRIFKLPDGYYFCNDYRIDKVTNPVDGIIHKCGSDFYDFPASYPETLYQANGVCNSFINNEEDTLLKAYFMHDDVIYAIETDKNGSYLSEFDGQKTIRLIKLNQRYGHIFSSDMGRFSGGNGGLFYCLSSPDGSDDRFSLIDIGNNLVRIINVKTNQLPSLSFSGKDGLKETLAFVTNSFSSKTIDDADVLENQLGSYRNTLPSQLKYESQYKSESRTYYRFIDNNTVVMAEYGSDSSTGFLNSLFLDWRPVSDLIYYNNEKMPFLEFPIRQKVIATINEVLPCKPKKKKEEYIWEIDGVKIHLWNSGIRLLIEKTK